MQPGKKIHYIQGKEWVLTFNQKEAKDNGITSLKYLKQKTVNQEFSTPW